MFTKMFWLLGVSRCLRRCSGLRGVSRCLQDVWVAGMFSRCYDAGVFGVFLDVYEGFWVAGCF